MALGILIAISLVLIGLAGLTAARGQQKLGTVTFLVIAALSPFIYGVMGFVAGAVGALLYNGIASVIGGIEMELRQWRPFTWRRSRPRVRVCSPDELSAQLEAFCVLRRRGGRTT